MEDIMTNCVKDIIVSLLVTFLVMLISLVTLSLPVFADGGDFSIDFTAAAPYTYDHSTGGGAYNDRTVGDSYDIVESLQGGEFSCFDIVTFLTAVSVDPEAEEAQTIELDFSFLADTTGQSGAALSDIVNVEVNYGTVENGDGPDGTDAGISNDDGGSTATLIYENLTGPLFESGSELQGTVLIDDLEANEKIILRMDVRIGCQLGSDPTGNLQANFSQGLVITPVQDTISGGEQTIPFQQIGDLKFPVMTIEKTVTTADGDCSSSVETLEVASGDTVKYCYNVTNYGLEPAYNVTLIDDNGTPDDPSDDFEVPLNNLTDPDSDGYMDDLAAGATADGFIEVVISQPKGAVVISTATADAENHDPVSDTATVDVALFPGLNIQKTVTTADGDCSSSVETLEVASGDWVKYCYRISNTGTASAYNITVVDDNGTPGDPSDDFEVVLSDLTDQDNDGYMDDLAKDEIAYGHSDNIQIREKVGEIVTNEAEATGDGADPVWDVATVEVADLPYGGLALQATVSTNVGSCPGEEIVNVLEETEVTWCYRVTNDTLFNIYDVNVTNNDSDFSETIPVIAPGGTETLKLNRVALADVHHVAFAAGIDEFGNERTAQDDAQVNVVSPGINIIKTIIVEGEECPGPSSSRDVVYGTDVTYCYEIFNIGDTDFSNISVTDDKLGNIGYIDSLPQDESEMLKSDPVLMTQDVTNTATAEGTDEFDFPVDDTGSAYVHVLMADLKITESGAMVVNLSETNLREYTVTVTNIGELTADDVSVTNDLPEGLDYLSADPGPGASCTYDDVNRILNCSLNGDLAPEETWIITVETMVAGIQFGSLENDACTETPTHESDYSNNCDDLMTWVAPGDTRTIGFYSNHWKMVEMCLEVNDGSIDLGFVTLKDEMYDDEIDDIGGGDKDDDVEEGLELAMGVLNANVAKYTNGKKRDRLLKARMKTGRQVLAAICNETLLGSDSGLVLEDAVEALAGKNVQTILWWGQQCDLFNNSGDMIALDSDVEQADLNAGPADPKNPWDDPTDPND
jgi:hypothetical protein